MIRMIIPNLVSWWQALAARVELFGLAFGLILAGRSIKSEYAGLGEPSYPAPVQNVNAWSSSGAVAFNGGTQTVTVTIATNPDGTHPPVRLGRWRLRITGVSAGTFIGIIVITVSDGTNTCIVAIIPAGAAAQKGFQVDLQGMMPPIDNNSNFGGASDGMPVQINTISASVPFTTTDGSGNSIGDIALEFFGGP